MWVMTTGGFVSAVQGSDPSVVVVRSRDRESLQNVIDGVELLQGLEAPEIIVGAGTDYPYRTMITKAQFAHWLAFEAVEYVNYSNFKDAVTRSRGKRWHDTLLRVWFAMFDTTDSEGKSAEVPPRTGRWSEGGAWSAMYDFDESEPDDETIYGSEMYADKIHSAPLETYDDFKKSWQEEADEAYRSMR